MSEKFDLVVVGTGPAAETVARKANKSGKTVAIVEARQFGGTCALRGCNPKKVYTNAGSLINQARHAQGKLARLDNPRIVWPELLAFKREFTQPVIEKSEQSFAKYGIATYHGTASFVDKQTVEVGGIRLEAERIFVASGAKPRTLQLQGAEHVVQSDEFLELEELPPRIVFIGGGYISMEFAHVAARAGAKVTVLQKGGQILTPFDPDLVEQLTAWSRSIGIDIRTQSEVSAVEKKGRSEFAVHYRSSDAEKQIEADLVVHGAGREPNTKALKLEAGGVACNEQGILVDEFLRSTTNPVVYAAGDCAATGVPNLTPTANEEARAVAQNLFEKEPQYKPDYRAIAQVAFTVPCIAAVGMSEAAARKRGSNVDVRHQETSTWGSVRKTGVELAGYKILVDKETDHILGAHLLGPAAEEVINLFALAIKFDLTATDLKSTLFAYPTFGADVRRMV